MVVALELVDELVDLLDLAARNHPQRDRLAATTVLLPCVHLGKRRVGRRQRAGVRKRLAFPLLPEDLEDRQSRTFLVLAGRPVVSDERTGRARTS